MFPKSCQERCRCRDALGGPKRTGHGGAGGEEITVQGTRLVRTPTREPAQTRAGGGGRGAQPLGRGSRKAADCVYVLT